MRKERIWINVLSILMCAVIFVSCGKTNIANSSTSIAQENSLNTDSEVNNNVKYADENYPYGSGDANGYYYLIHDESANYILHYIDYSTLKDIVLCSSPNCSHDSDECSARFLYCGTSANIYVEENYIYILFNGSPWDQSAYEMYGKDALPHIVRCNLDGSERKTIAEFEASCVISSVPAIDKEKMYTVITSYSDANGSGVQKLVSIDLNNGAQTYFDLQLNEESASETSANFQLSPESRIVGAYGRKLVIQSLTGLNATSYISYNVDNNAKEILYNDKKIVSCVCKDEYCYLLEEATGVIRKINIDSGEEVEIATDLLANRDLKWIVLSYVTNEGYVVQAKDNGETSNFLIDSRGNVKKQSIKGQSTDPQDKKRQLQIFDQWNGFYLVSPSRDFIMMSVPGENNTYYNLSEIKYSFAMISANDFWNDTENYEIIS